MPRNLSNKQAYYIVKKLHIPLICIAANINVFRHIHKIVKYLRLCSTYTAMAGFKGDATMLGGLGACPVNLGNYLAARFFTRAFPFSC